MITLPTKFEAISGIAFATLGVLTVIFFPTFKSAGWFALFYSVTIYLFPGPQLREKYKQTEESKKRWKHRAISESSEGLKWWASPMPWAGLICVVLVVFASVT